MANSLGQDPVSMLTRFGVPKEMQGEATLHLPSIALSQILEACAEDWHCPDFGLRLASFQQLDLLGPVGLVARLHDNVFQALEAVCLHTHWYMSSFRAELHVEQTQGRESAIVSFVPCHDLSAKRQYIEFSLLSIRNIISMISGAPNLRSQKVTIALPAAVSLLTVQAIFDCPVLYGQKVSSIVFDAAVMSRANGVRDVACEKLIAQHLDELRKYASVNPVDATRRVIENLLQTGYTSQQAVAKCLKVHPRKLQRDLQQHGTSFAALLNDCRRIMALNMMTKGSKPLAVLATDLGYSDQSAFNQAFKRWTGTTPTMYLRDHSI